MLQAEPLVIIPARGQSKGIPGKNIKLLAGKPLVYYTIEAAREVFKDEQICVSTDDPTIIDTVKKCNLNVPFVRPGYLSTDNANTEEVILHAIDYYQARELQYHTVVLLQPTSPFRNGNHIQEALKIFNDEYDMVVSVKKSTRIATLCKEFDNNYLKRIISEDKSRRQDFENYYELNGAIYIINTNSLKQKSISNFTRVKKYVMDEKYSLDIDDDNDWLLAEFLIQMDVL